MSLSHHHMTARPQQAKPRFAFQIPRASTGRAVPRARPVSQGRCSLRGARLFPVGFAPCFYVLLAATPASAQTVALPPVKVEAPPQACTDVQVDGQRRPALACLNAQLKASAQDATPPTDPNAAIHDVVGNGEPNKVGTFSRTGQSIRMGNTFGTSSKPQRPPAPVYAPPLATGAP